MGEAGDRMADPKGIEPRLRGLWETNYFYGPNKPSFYH